MFNFGFSFGFGVLIIVIVLVVMAFNFVGDAVRDAFDALRRQLEDHARRRRGDIKSHATVLHGRVAELYLDYGKIETSDGRLVYFHKNSVLDADFSQLKIGTEVRFDEETGELGPQASTVKPMGKHSLRT